MSDQNKSHIERVNKIRRLVEKCNCENNIAREALKQVNWNELEALSHIQTQNVIKV